MFGTLRIWQSRLRCITTQLAPVYRSQLQLSRHASTIASNSAAIKSKWPRRLIYAGIFGGLGVAAGKLVDEKISPPALPGTVEDAAKLEEIYRVYEDGLPIVRELRKNPDFVESNVYEDITEELLARRFTSGPLRGSRGLALQKVFWNEKEKTVVSVVYLGSGLEGWPTVVHGGAIAAVLDENLGRAAIRHLPERTGVTANLEINYRAPVYSGNFYTCHATVDPEKSSDRKAYVTGEVRDPVGRICAQASALFVVPKGFKLRTVGERF
ncbi:PaaI family thioesterase [Aspergillus clavatus NRRL 1]|uniref:Thioesterase family protein n=1 Tax=Aspergillus clavatus (strain ATCC 1007 / CBS 513.65 / DSM 816 / NCTC 3887 / NRRL 1 / QM 1276 / 107) TaxID=344612 RepID=A1CMS9_ASPCL|nr:thioesterase family protein [Aspergillus clavatus NRRL 1]EAW08866.1 thioesterase family protein [Aspergillus clavatus NRRL 1]